MIGPVKIEELCQQPANLAGPFKRSVLSWCHDSFLMAERVDGWMDGWMDGGRYIWFDVSIDEPSVKHLDKPLGHAPW